MKNFFLLAFNNLKRRKVRSWLTMIGIFIGIAAVVALISLGQGLQNYITGEFEKLGTDKIIIQQNVFAPPGSVTSKELLLTDKDLKTVENVRGVEWVIGMLVKIEQIEYKKEKTTGYLFGIDPEDTDFLKEVQNLEIQEGRQLKTGDKFKAVIGYNHAYSDIWDNPLKIGNGVIIGGQEFKVIGIYEKIGNPADDSAITIPKEELREITNSGEEESQILAKTMSGFEPSKVAEEIKRKLRSERDEKEGDETFRVQTSEQLLETFSSIFAVVQAVLVGIAAISLLVGGIGIMNTMYTSVLERTREIGTMKAIGAKNSDILSLFLIESGLLGLVGGAIGIAIGVGIAKATEYFAGQALGTNFLQAAFPWYLIIGALAFSFIIGSLSGLLPAMQASRLNPADALRYE